MKFSANKLRNISWLLLALGFIVFGLEFLIPGENFHRVFYGPEVLDPSVLLWPRIVMVFLAVAFLISGLLLLKLSDSADAYDPYDLSKYASSYEYQELFDLVERMSFALPPDCLEWITSFLQHGESEIGLNSFLTILDDFEVPIPRTVFQRLSSICAEDFPELVELVEYLRPRVVEDDEAESLWELQKQKLAKEQETAQPTEPPVDPLQYEKLRYPNLETYLQMIQAGASRREITIEIHTREQTKLSGIAMLRRLYEISLPEAKQLWEDEAAEE